MTDTTPAADLRRIADLLDQGLPVPIGLAAWAAPIRIHVGDEDLTDWLIALDAPEPTWRFAENTGSEHTEVVAGGFVLTACRPVPETPEDELSDPLFAVEAVAHG